MNGKAHRLGRIVTGLALVASIAMLAAQSAAAVDGRSPDTRAAALPAGGGIAIDLRSPDTRDVAGAATGNGAIRISTSSGPVADVRSPDARDAAGSAGTSAERTVASSSEAFDWGDFGLGAGIAAGALLLVALLAAAGLSGRRRTPTTV